MKKKIILVWMAAVLALTGCSAGETLSNTSSPVSETAFDRDSVPAASSEPAASGNKAPSRPASRRVLNTIQVYNAEKEPVRADLTMDEVPENYYIEPKEQGKIEKFYYSTNTYGLYGRAKKKIRKYAEVYLPFGYTPSKRYNIVYLMHGAGGSAERFFGSALKPRGLKAIVDNLTALGEIKPMIFVNLTYYEKNGQKREDDWDAEYTKAYNQELIHDVLPQVESHYSTYAKSTNKKGLTASRNHRAFGGYSMGAVTTCYRITDSLRYFHSFIAMSGSLYWGPDAAQDENFNGAEYLMNAVSRQGYTKDDFFLYSATGTKDFALDIVKQQIESEKKYPDFFRFGEDIGATETANCAFETGDGEKHGGQHASDRYLYNALPLLSKTLE